jgi:hypothetical protein
MANRTAWTAGNGAGFTFSQMFTPADIAGLTNGGSVLSTWTAVANQTNLDFFADISLEFTIATATVTAGAYFGIWIAALGNDGSTYGDGHLVGGTALAYVPPWSPAAIFPLGAFSTVAMRGYAQQVMLPYNSFRWILYNNSGVTLSATTANNTTQFITANVQLNN